MNARTWLRGALAVAVSATVLTGATGASAAPKSTGKPTTVGAGAVASGDTGRYLVRYAPGTDVAAAARSLRSQGLGVRRTFGHAVRAAAVTATPAQAAALTRSPRVQAVEVDAVVRASGTQSNAPWGLDRVDQRALPLSGTYTAPATGAGVEAYVVDTGVLPGHTDFGGRVAPGWTAINDGVGSSDCNGHGTHVAGTVAGATHGVAKAATVVPVRVLGCDGSGYMSDVVAGLDWVVARHSAGTPAVVNLSLGGGISSTLDAALNGAVNDGVTAVVAAGNSAADACNASPARVPAALTVAASDSGDRQASFSNFGTCVDMYAPGVSVRSTWHTSTTSTASLSGTSMSAPHVAGAAAVLLSQQPGLSPAEVATNLTSGATAGAVTGATSGTPNRLLYLAPAAQDEPAQPQPDPVQSEPEPVQPEPEATVPSAPTGLTATADKRSASLAWVQGADGGSPLTGQTVTVYSGTKRVGTVSVSGTATAVKVTGLKTKASYAFTVTATNKLGSSPESARSNTVVALR